MEAKKGTQLGFWDNEGTAHENNHFSQSWAGKKAGFSRRLKRKKNGG